MPYRMINKAVTTGIQTICVIILCFTILVICGYIFKNPAVYTWPKGSDGMALPTAISFGLISICNFFLAKSIKEQKMNV